jgi:RecA/RadA recombinase
MCHKLSYQLWQGVMPFAFHFIFYFQVRLNPKSGQRFGRMDEVTCAGNALKFYAAVRLKMIRKELLKTEDKVIFCHF